MSDNKWHSGPPPSVGWWPASIDCNAGVYRWWNGRRWSYWADATHSGFEAGRIAKQQEIDSEWVFWKHRPKSWPKRSFT